MTQWNDERRPLLQALQNIGGAGRAEGEREDRIAPGFFPVSEHLRLLDPEVVLVVGPRGAGKTEIARVLAHAGLYDAIKRYSPAVRLPPGRSRWVAAHPTGPRGFEPRGLKEYVAASDGVVDQVRDLWFAYLVRTLHADLGDNERDSLTSLLRPNGADIAGIMRAFQGLSTTPVSALDELDARLEKRNEFIFITYDELDTLGGGDWRLIEAGVEGLVAFWATYSRRWKRIRAKLFLRTDLYDRHAKVGGADLAKLAAGRVELIWNDRDLYGLLLKRLANVDPELTDYVLDVRGVQWTSDKVLGNIPVLKQWQDARPVIERMVGAYMGANQKKGLVFRWLIDHVKDGLGRALPRPLVRLVEEGARQELAHFGSVRPRRLLEPVSLRRALDRVSEDHVAQSRDEWPWLDRVKGKLATNSLVPWDKERDIARLLDEFSTTDKQRTPPFEGRELVEYLLEIGVLRRRPDHRIDAPDLFLSGLGLRRKGGVRKR